MWAKCNVPILAILLSGPRMMIAALMVSLELIAGAESVYTDIYNFPMLGVLVHETSRPADYEMTAYGTVTIVHKRMVLCAAENLVQLDPYNSKFIFDDVLFHDFKVYAGSDLMQPPRRYEENKLQYDKVKSIRMAKSSSFVAAIDKNTNWDELKRNYRNVVVDRLKVDPPRLDRFPKDFVFNAFSELQWDVAILVLENGFNWSPYVLPIPLHWRDNKKLTQQYREFWDKISEAEKHPHKFAPCSVPGWSPIGNNEIIYHRVVYVRFKDCAEAICGAYPSSCLNYLNVRQHICFKSLGFADSCVLDQGAPVICSWTKPNANPDVLGILVKTFECGSQGLPLVFTRTYAIAAFAKIGMDDGDDFDVEEPALLDPNYTEKPAE